MTFSDPVRLSESAYAGFLAKVSKWPCVEVQANPLTYTKVYSETELDPILCSPEHLARLLATPGKFRVLHTEQWYEVTVSLNAPVIAGHTFLARLEHLSEGNVVYAPKETTDLPTSYRHAPATCQHCLTSRRRSDTFVLRDDTKGTTKQIGRNCLAEYVRDAAAAERLLQWASWGQSVLAALSDAEEKSSGSTGRAYYDFASVVALAAAYCEKVATPWVSAAKAKEEFGARSTASLLLECVSQPDTKDSPKWFPIVREASASPEAKAAAAQCLAWIEALRTRDDSALSDYESNLCVLSASGSVHAGQFSLAASAWRAYQRAGVIADTAAKADVPVTGEHVGTVGVRSDFFGLTCVLVKSLGLSDYGERFIIKFTDAAGNEYVWFTGEGTKFGPEEGQTYDITATVKEHGEYRKKRNTVITRVSEYKAKVKKTPTRKGKKDGKSADGQTDGGSSTGCNSEEVHGRAEAV